MTRALITGISGQDGSYLAELLISKGYEVHGIVLPVEMVDPAHSLWRIYPILNRLHLVPASIENHIDMLRIVRQGQPDECYHLAAQSVVSFSPNDESDTLRANINGTHNLLSALKESAPNCRFYFAGSSEMFGRVETSPQNEDTPFHPRSAYGISKVTGFHLTRYYREEFGLFACNGILYNHESERRGTEFVTRKISHGVAQIKHGLIAKIQLGNLDAVRDWGYSPDYVDAMWRMLRQEKPDDFVVATGETHSVSEFAELAFADAGLNWRDFVVVDDRLVRPAESIPLTGDATKARKRLGWTPKIGFRELVRRMVQSDLAEISAAVKPG